MLKTCCIHSGVPPDQGLAGCTPHRQGLPPCHSLRWECFSMRSHNFPTPLSTSALQYLQAQKIEGACWYYCTPKFSLLPGISYIAKPDTTKKCHNLICTFKGKKKNQTSKSIHICSSGSSLHICDPALYKFSVRRFSSLHDVVQLFCGEKNNVA